MAYPYSVLLGNGGDETVSALLVVVGAVPLVFYAYSLVLSIASKGRKKTGASSPPSSVVPVEADDDVGVSCAGTKDSSNHPGISGENDPESIRDSIRFYQ